MCKVIVDDLESNRVYEFPCNRWLAKDEDDGQISRELLCGGAGTEGISITLAAQTSLLVDQSSLVSFRRNVEGIVVDNAVCRLSIA